MQINDVTLISGKKSIISYLRGLENLEVAHILSKYLGIFLENKVQTKNY